MPEMNATCQIRGNPRLFRQKSPIGTGQDSFVFFLLWWVFAATCRLSLVVLSGGTLRLSVLASPCGGFSLEHGLEALRLGSCSSWAQ